MRRGGTRALLTVIAAVAVALPVAYAGACDRYPPRPSPSVVFVDAWTNDDGAVDRYDTGDTGEASAGFDVWPLNVSSNDPTAPGPVSPRLIDDAAVCTAEVRSTDLHVADVKVDNGYPQYICTVSVVIENHLRVRAKLGPTSITTDPGLEVLDISDPPLPGVLRPGRRATARYSVRVLNSAEQLATLGFSIETGVSEKWCKRGRTCRPKPVVRPPVCNHFFDWCGCNHGSFAWRCAPRSWHR